MNGRDKWPQPLDGFNLCCILNAPKRVLPGNFAGSMRWFLAGTLTYICCAVGISQTTNQAGTVRSEFIFEAGTAPFAQCHASTLAECRDHLVAAWFGGTAERNPDVGIWFSRLEQGHW